LPLNSAMGPTKRPPTNHLFLQKEKVTKSKKRKIESDEESLQSLDEEKEDLAPGSFWIDKKRMRRVEVTIY
jgi:hypothetical protein